MGLSLMKAERSVSLLFVTFIQELANLSPQASSDPVLFVISTVLLEHSHILSFLYCLGQLSQYSRRTEELQKNRWPAKPKIFPIWPFVGKSYWPLL